MFSRLALPLLALSASLVVAYPGAVTAEEEVVSETELLKRQQFQGVATVYSINPPGSYGSCGSMLYDSGMFVALSNYYQMSESPGPACGKTITLTNTGASYSGIEGVGNSVTVTVTDTCPSCSQTHLDLSVAAWNALTNSSPYGKTGISWEFNS